MPKTRSSGNTIASRGGGSGGGAGSVGFEGNEEMSDRIQDRMEEARTVTVLVESRTRDEIEEVQVTFDPALPGMATVGSASGNTYMVDTEEETCTCPDHQFRRSRCRHIEGVALAQEQMGRGTTIGTSEAQNINVNETVREHMAHEMAEEAHTAERGFTDDEHFYADDPEQFARELERMRNEPIPYEYENVLNGSDITFGIELEFVGGDSHAIARDLHIMGICQYDHMIPYHAETSSYYRRYYGDQYRSGHGKWKLESDGSVTSGDFGGELVSPVLRDTPETWRQIETICEVTKRHGGRVNYQTGGHVHISAEPLDGKRQRWRRLFKTFQGTEEAVFRFSGGEQGRFRGDHYSESSQSDMLRGRRMRLPEEGELSDFSRALNQGGNWQKYRSLNIRPFAEGTRNALEVRAFNGSLTPGVIQANIKVAAGLIHTAERSRTRNIDEGIVSDAFKRRGTMINQYGSNGKDNNTLIRFVDTYFTRKKDKEHIMSILAKNSWR